MKIVELHPEELLDKETSGMLTRAERAVLEAHAARCAACGCERQLRLEFAEVLSESGSAGESECEGEGQSGSASASTSEGGRWWGRRAPWGGAVAVVVAVVTVVAVGQGSGAASVAEPRASARSVGRGSAAAVQVVRGRRPAAVLVARSPGGGAASIFDEANRARARGDYGGALTGYRRLQEHYATSREARLSYATMGRLQLDHADARGALATFDRYQRWGNPEVDEVVLSGRALALDELGSDVASRAWAVLLRSHPDTPYAAHARDRARAGGLAL